MRTPAGYRSSMVTVALWLAALALAQGARADVPMCNDIVQDPTIATCSCICETGSLFPACIGRSEGTVAATPGQCPDMLQGRRVLSRGDALAIAAPRYSGSSNMIALGSIYRAEKDPDNAGLGVIDGEAELIRFPNIGCRTQGGPAVPFPDQVRLARLFELPYAVMVQLRPSADRDQVEQYYCHATSPSAKNMVLAMSHPQGGTDAPSVPTYAWQINPEWVQLAVGDLNYDGYDDLVFLNRNVIQVYTAVDPADPTQGIQRVASANTRLPSGALRAPINRPVTGDFNGDGIMDVAWIGGDFPNKTGTLSVFFASICPGSVTNTLCEGKQPFQVIVDPASALFPGVSGATSTIALDDATLTPTGCGVVQTARTQSTSATDSMRAGAIALGNFENSAYNARGAPVNGLVVAYISGTSSKHQVPDRCKLDTQYWSYAPPDASNPVWARQRGDTLSDIVPEIGGTLSIVPTFTLYAQAAYLDWYGATQQAVIGFGGSLPYSGSFWIPITVAVAGTGNGARASACAGPLSDNRSSYPYPWGLAVGRFSDSTTINPANTSACRNFPGASPGDCPYNLQIGMLVAQDNENGGGSGNPSIQLYSVVESDPFGSDASMKCSNDASVRGYLPLAGRSNNLTSGFHSVPTWMLRGGSLLTSGDAFGNSVRLGPPTVVRVSEHSEPQLVIQAPPSLVDYLQPNEHDSSIPAIVNFTRAPNNYQAQIRFDTGSQDTASTRQTRSVSSSTTETVAGRIKFDFIGTTDVKNQESWTQFKDNTDSQQLGTYATTRLQTGGAIGVDDQVWWTQTTFNVFNYPLLGEDACPATSACDPETPGCDGAASGAALTCTESGSGCRCLSAGASVTLCPEMPSDAAERNCASQGANACCTFLPQQLNVMFSGPQEVTRSSSPGATIEWYQPRHEPGQILSYPANATLIQQRQPNSESLANLTTFTTGTNNTSESMSWSCGTTSDVSTGTTTRHSFESDTSITVGMNNLNVVDSGLNLTFEFNYQQSNSFATLNSYTAGLTASSSVGLLLEGAGFLNPDQYAYAVSGLVLGAKRPASVIDNPTLTVCPVDNPRCAAVEEVQADCATTGPITVAFAADPTATGNGAWWSATSPYLNNIDVALNNPSRWRRVAASQVANPHLQCRGPANTPVCYASNQPPTGTGATDVWGSLFYNIKGLLVTNGGTGGPMRNTATVGDRIYLQARVYNYSLKDMDPGARVYARFYRQQMDVNNSKGALSVLDYAQDADGNPLPAVPVGPDGLGDSRPIPVKSALDGSATIPPFNTSTDPAWDNISLATVAYTTADDDACEYDSGVQSCEGAYYAYWVTVWAEDANGNVVSELPGHGLGAGFDPGQSYGFITDVPLEPVSSAGDLNYFTNNVGMFKMLFSIVPAVDANGTLAATRPRPGLLSLDRMTVSAEKALLGEPVVVSAQVVAENAAAEGATVVFSDGDPQNGGTAFDAEWLPTIRANDREYVSVDYIPESCGPHEIYADVTGGSNVRPAEQVALIDVGIDYHSAIRYLIRLVDGFAGDTSGFDGPWRKANDAAGQHPGNGFTAAQVRVLKNELVHAERALDALRTDKAIDHLRRFAERIAQLESEGLIDRDRVDALLAQAEQLIGCVR